MARFDETLIRDLAKLNAQWAEAEAAEVQITLSPEELEVCREHARAAETGGRSNVDPARRLQSEYQLSGQLGEAALCLWAGRGFEHYHKRREAMNRTPHRGDCGCDLLHQGYRVDVKCSFVRTDLGRLNHRLWVRKRERRADRYVLGLVYPSDPATVYLMGWWPDGAFIEGRHNRRVADRYEVIAYELYQLRGPGYFGWGHPKLQRMETPGGAW